MIISKLVGQKKSNHYNEYDIIPFFPQNMTFALLTGEIVDIYTFLVVITASQTTVYCAYQIGDMQKSPGSHNVSTRLE